MIEELNAKCNKSLYITYYATSLGWEISSYYSKNLNNKNRICANDFREAIEKAMKKLGLSTEVYTLLPTDEIIEYIEKTEQRWYGDNRTIEELIKDNAMPELYDKLLALRNG